MTEIKPYEVEAFRFGFTPHKNPFRGTLYTTYPELDPYLDQITLSDAGSR
jgi:hypothetical protein